MRPLLVDILHTDRDTWKYPSRLPSKQSLLQWHRHATFSVSTNLVHSLNSCCTIPMSIWHNNDLPFIKGGEYFAKSKMKRGCIIAHPLQKLILRFIVDWLPTIVVTWIAQAFVARILVLVKAPVDTLWAINIKANNSFLWWLWCYHDCMVLKHSY